VAGVPATLPSAPGAAGLEADGEGAGVDDGLGDVVVEEGWAVAAGVPGAAVEEPGGDGAGVTAAAFVPVRTMGIASAAVSSMRWDFSIVIGAPGDLCVGQKLLPVLLERVTNCYCCDYC